MKIFWTILIGLCLCVSSTYAQISATAKLDTNQILIGDQAKLKLEVSYPKGSTAVFPAFGNTLDQVEIVRTSSIDSTIVGDVITKSQTLYITAWDSGFYAIPKIPINVQNQKVETDVLLFTVQTVQVDTQSEIMPIKPIISISAMWFFVLLALVALLLLGLLVFSIYWWRKRRRKGEEVEEAPPPPPLPAHEIAFEKLNVLDSKQLWQKGKTKTYYSELTEILREYMEGRFEIPAMESTSDEIMQAVRPLSIKNTLKERLAHLLSLADLAKFAKAQPTEEDNRQSIKDVRNFVKRTIPKTHDVETVETVEAESQNPS